MIPDEKAIKSSWRNMNSPKLRPDLSSAYLDMYNINNIDRFESSEQICF